MQFSQMASVHEAENKNVLDPRMAHSCDSQLTGVPKYGLSYELALNSMTAGFQE